MNNQVEEVKSKTDIVAIIGERIELKKAGRNWKANCPFHGEKTPSFMVTPELQIYKCFGCGLAGDCFTFLEQYEGMEFPEALKYLADRAGIKLIKQNFGDTSEKEKLTEIIEKTSQFYHYMLLSRPEGKKALEYLINARGIKLETIKEFQLGFAPENSYIISDFLIGKHKYNPLDIEKAGIGIPKSGNVYDRFNGRVIFPLKDHRGNTIGFAGRVLPWDKRETGKYINSPETLVYHKSSVLYGLDKTRVFIKKKKTAIIVEGELDAISSFQAGIKNVVAIKGSALTTEQVRLLSRFAEKFILALDADLAGNAAAIRGLTVASNSGLEIKVATLTNYKDPDEAARGDIESYKLDLINAKNVWDFLIESIIAKNNLSNGGGKAKASKELVPILQSIEDKIIQAHYANIVAQKLGVPLEAVTEQSNKQSLASEAGKPLETQKSTEQIIEKIDTRREMLEQRLLSLAFKFEPKILKTKEISEIISDPAYLKIISHLDDLSKFNIQEFGKKLPPELFDKFSLLVLIEEENEKELDLVKKELKILVVKEKLKNLAINLRDYEVRGDKDGLLKAQNLFNKLTLKLSSLNSTDDSGVIFDLEDDQETNIRTN